VRGATFAYNHYIIRRPPATPPSRYLPKRCIGASPPTEENDTMKTTIALAAGLLSVISASAFAQNGAVDQVRADNAAIRHDTHEIRAERRDIHHDSASIAAEKRDIAHDRNVIAMEKRDARHDQRREDALVAKGDLKDARKLDRARRHELNEAKIAARDVRHDRNEIAIERTDRAHDKAALADERAERRADVVKRNHDAAHLR
jgi:hypothetical protein